MTTAILDLHRLEATGGVNGETGAPYVRMRAFTPETVDGEGVMLLGDLSAEAALSFAMTTLRCALGSQVDGVLFRVLRDNGWNDEQAAGLIAKLRESRAEDGPEPG